MTSTHAFQTEVSWGPYMMACMQARSGVIPTSPALFVIFSVEVSVGISPSMERNGARRTGQIPCRDSLPIASVLYGSLHQFPTSICVSAGVLTWQLVLCVLVVLVSEPILCNKCAGFGVAHVLRRRRLSVSNRVGLYSRRHGGLQRLIVRG